MIHPDGRTHVAHRETARIVLHDGAGTFLLMLTHFDAQVGLPPRWITPGGGIDDGETPLEAAVRELREETGLIAAPSDLEGPIDVVPGYWDWPDGQRFHSYVDHFFGFRTEQFEIDRSGWTESERHDVLDVRWWTLAELEAEKPFVGPPELARVVSGFIR